MSKYKVGDKVRIKSLNWYNRNKEEHGLVVNSYKNIDVFCDGMASYCGEELTVKSVLPNGEYTLTDNEGYGTRDLYMWAWADWMFEE